MSRPRSGGWNSHRGNNFRSSSERHRTFDMSRCLRYGDEPRGRRPESRPGCRRTKETSAPARRKQNSRANKKTSTLTLTRTTPSLSFVCTVSRPSRTLGRDRDGVWGPRSLPGTPQRDFETLTPGEHGYKIVGIFTPRTSSSRFRQDDRVRDSEYRGLRPEGSG